jgi:hypothetical protein
MLAQGRQRIAQHLDYRSRDGTPGASRFVIAPQGAGEPMASFYEFFAGGGMARAGLGPDWQCLLANDFDPKKAASYAANWGPIICASATWPR